MLQHEIEQMMGSRIVKADRVFGGFGPSATFRLYMEDGRTIFAKGAGKGSTSYNWESVSSEEYIYETVNCIKPFAPVYLGSMKTSEWHLIFLEDVSKDREVPPWTEKLAKQAMHGIANFHISGLDEREKATAIDITEYNENWKSLKENEAKRECFFALFGDKKSEAEFWFWEVIDQLMDAEDDVLASDQPWGLIHFDLRADNMRFRDGKLILFDWSLMCYGPLILDATFFFPSVKGQGGPTAKVLMREYQKVLKKINITFPHFCIDAAAAFTAGYFASRAGKDQKPLLPRIRELQRMQLGPALEWMTTRMNLPQSPCIKF